jgi:hypothetical protein
VTLFEIFIAAQIVLICGFTPLMPPNAQPAMLVSALIMACTQFMGVIGIPWAFCMFCWMEANAREK